MRPWFLENSHLGERGLREIGAWPSDDPYDALLELIERQIAAAPDEAAKSNRGPQGQRGGRWQGHRRWNPGSANDGWIPPLEVRCLTT